MRETLECAKCAKCLTREFEGTEKRFSGVASVFYALPNRDRISNSLPYLQCGIEPTLDSIDGFPNLVQIVFEPGQGKRQTIRTSLTKRCSYEGDLWNGPSRHADYSATPLNNKSHIDGSQADLTIHAAEWREVGCGTELGLK
jgi:hypothetical protein